MWLRCCTQRSPSPHLGSIAARDPSHLCLKTELRLSYPCLPGQQRKRAGQYSANHWHTHGIASQGAQIIVGKGFQRSGRQTGDVMTLERQTLAGIQEHTGSWHIHAAASRAKRRDKPISPASVPSQGLRQVQDSFRDEHVLALLQRIEKVTFPWALDEVDCAQAKGRRQLKVGRRRLQAPAVPQQCQA